MFSFLRRLFSPVSPPTRHERWKQWRRSLRTRTAEQYTQLWAAELLPQPQTDTILREVAAIMGLRPALIYPTDDIFLILYNASTDLREVESIIYLEEHLSADFEQLHNTYSSSGLTVAELFKMTMA